MNCKTCNRTDLECYEQCKEDRCKECFGASFNDCFECDRYNKRAEEVKDVSGTQKK